MLVHFRRQDDPVSRNLYADLYIQTRTAKYLRQRQAAGVRGGQAPGPEATLGKLSLSRNMAMVTRFVSAVLGSTLIADSGEWGTLHGASSCAERPASDSAAAQRVVRRASRRSVRLRRSTTQVASPSAEPATVCGCNCWGTDGPCP